MSGTAAIHHYIQISIGLDHLAVGITNHSTIDAEVVGFQQLVAWYRHLINIGVTGKIGNLAHRITLAVQIKRHIATIW